MNELIKKQLDDAKAHMEKAIEFCDNELIKIRAGKAMPTMLDGIYVDYYGTPTALNQIGTVNTPDARTLVVQPWEKTMLISIERAIMEANIGLNPQNDGIVIRLNVPPLTEERRKDLVKKLKRKQKKDESPYVISVKMRMKRSSAQNLKVFLTMKSKLVKLKLKN